MKFEDLMQLMALIAKLQDLTARTNTPVAISVMGDTGYVSISTEGIELECLGGSWVVKKTKEK